MSLSQNFPLFHGAQTIGAKIGVTTFTQSMNNRISLWQKYPEIEKAISHDL